MREGGVAHDGGERHAARDARRVERRISTSAAAPSEIDEALAAVTVPPSRKAGFSAGIRSASALPGPSSSDTCRSARPALTATGTISSAKAPSTWAARARRKDSSA